MVCRVMYWVHQDQKKIISLFIRGCPRVMRQLDTYWDGEHSCNPPDRNIEKNENPPRWPFRNWLILNGHRGGIFIFFFFGPVDWQECSRGWGGGGARDWERGPQNRRGVAADCPGFEYISMLIYYIFVVWRPFCDNLTILSQKSDSKFIISHTFLVEEKPIMSFSCSVYEIQTQIFFGLDHNMKKSMIITI